MLKHSTIRKGSIHIGPRSFTIAEYVLSPEPPASKQVSRLIQRGILVHVREEKVDAAPAVVPVPEPSGAGDGLVASDLPVAGNESPPVTALDYSTLSFDDLLVLANGLGLDTKGMRSKRALIDAILAAGVATPKE